MSKRNILFLIFNFLIVILGVVSHLQIQSSSLFLLTFLSLCNIFFWIYAIWILFFFKRKARKNIGKVEEVIYPLMKEEKYDEILDYLNGVIKKAYIPSTTKFAYAYITLIYITKEDLNTARKYLNNKFIRNHYLLASSRIFISLYDNDINEANKVYDKYIKIANKLYGQTKIDYLNLLKFSKKAIVMCETKVFDEELYNETSKEYIKELCLRYKTN